MAICAINFSGTVYCGIGGLLCAEYPRKKVKSLSKKVKSLSRKVKTLSKKVKTLSKKVKYFSCLFKIAFDILFVRIT